MYIRSHAIHVLIYTTIIVLLYSCAIPGAPMGGPKDVSPPKIIRQQPAAQATNVQSTRLIIEFDEYIRLDNPKQNLLISPPPSRFPEVHVKKKTIEIVFYDSLQPNTTYSLQFGDNIKDANESNALSNFNWVFSTGDKLDSLELSGKVQAAGLNAIPDNTWATLYSNLEDSAFTSERPYYFTKVDKSGSFTFNYLKEGNYKLYLLEDKNRNFFYDLPTEKTGFLDTVVTLLSNNSIPKMVLFEPEAKSLYLSDYNTSWKNNQWQLTLSRALPKEDSWRVKPVSDSIHSVSRIQEDRKTIITWVKNDTAYPLFTFWEISVNDSILDTIRVGTIEKTEPKQQTRTFGTQGAEQAIAISPPEEIRAIEGEVAIIPFTKPLLSINSALLILGDSTTTDSTLESSIGADSLSINIKSTLRPGKYSLKVPPEAMEIYTGKAKDTIQYLFRVTDKKELGSLTLNLSFGAENQYVISVRNDKAQRIYQETVQPTDRQKQILLANIFPGKYIVQVIEDADKNGILTPGSFFEKRQPERSFQSAPIDLKAGWEQESTILVTFD